MDFNFNKEDIINLTDAVYRVTEVFPKNDPLFWQIREISNNILADFLLFQQSDLAKKELKGKIKLILAYLELAKSRKLAHLKNFLVLERDYQKISDNLVFEDKKPTKQNRNLEKIDKIEIQNSQNRQKSNDFIKNSDNKEKKSFFEPLKDGFSSSPWSRQEKVVAIIKDKGEVSLEELQNVFSQVSPRTLRRDLKSLTEKSVIYRNRKSKKDVLFGLSQKLDDGPKKFNE